jgi:predicted Fe-S protein YdhL (DUF1289 family)
MQPSVPPYVVDPDDPRAPPQEVWERMTADERKRVIDSLPSEFDFEARVRRAEEALEEQAGLRAEEARLRADAERRLEAALAEIERLKASR